MYLSEELQKRLLNKKVVINTDKNTTVHTYYIGTIIEIDENTVYLRYDAPVAGVQFIHIDIHIITTIGEY